MNHTPYEDWLLDDPTKSGKYLSGAEQLALDTHLSECPACRGLSQALQRVENELHKADTVSPVDGFGARWLARLESDRIRLHRKQSYRFIGVSVGLALGMIVYLVYLAWPFLRTPTILLWASLYQAIRVLSLANLSREFISNFTVTANLSIPPSLWVLAVGIVCQICVLWLVSYRYLTNPRRVTK